MPKCVECGKALIKFRTSYDWNSRNLHKKCYKKIEEIRVMKERLKRWFPDKFKDL